MSGGRAECVLFVAPEGMDDNSDRARRIAGACPNVEIRDVDTMRLNDMPDYMTGVPTLVSETSVHKGSDAFAELAAWVVVPTGPPPNPPGDNPLGNTPVCDTVLSSTTAASGNDSKLTTKEFEAKLNAYKSRMST